MSRLQGALLAAASTVLPGMASADPATYGAIVEMDADKRIQACGVTASTTGDDGVTVEMRLRFERAGAEPLTALEVRATRDGAPASPTDVTGAVLTTDGATSGAALTRDTGAAAGVYRATGRLPPGHESTLFRDFVLAGGTLELARGDAKATVPFTGRAPIDVFRSYLACSGELYQAE